MKRLFYSATIAAVAWMGNTPAARAQAAWPIIYKATGVSVALDTADARRNRDGSYVTRTRWDYAEPHKLESKRPYTQMTEVALIKCTPLRIKRLTESFYGPGGAVVKEGTMPDAGEIQYMNWDRPVLRSQGARAFSNICALLTRRDKGKR